MKKIMTSLALALIATAALAQQKQGSFSFVPRVGVTIANLTDNDLTLERGGTIKSKSKPGFAVGADAFYQLTDCWNCTYNILHKPIHFHDCFRTHFFPFLIL